MDGSYDILCGFILGVEMDRMEGGKEKEKGHFTWSSLVIVMWKVCSKRGMQTVWSLV